MFRLLNKNKLKEGDKLAKEKFRDAKINTLDGCRFDFDDGWVHLRTSNTEPVMRLIVETKDRGDAVKYVDVVTTIRGQVCGGEKGTTN